MSYGKEEAPTLEGDGGVQGTEHQYHDYNHDNGYNTVDGDEGDGDADGGGEGDLEEVGGQKQVNDQHDHIVPENQYEDEDEDEDDTEGEYEEPEPEEPSNVEQLIVDGLSEPGGDEDLYVGNEKADEDEGDGYPNGGFFVEDDKEEFDEELLTVDEDIEDEETNDEVEAKNKELEKVEDINVKPPTIIQGVIQDKAESKEDVSDIVIITGITDDYLSPLYNLLDSISFFEPDLKVIVYDLGLDTESREKVLGWDMVSELRTFDFSKYPAFFNICSHGMAWKPVLIVDALEEFERVLWLDAGFELVGNLNFVRRNLESVGYYVAEARGKTVGDVDQAKMHFFGANDIAEEPMCDSAIVGFDLYGEAYVQIAVTWRDCALKEECIGPSTDPLRNPEEETLSIITHQAGTKFSEMCYSRPTRKQLLADQYEQNGYIKKKCHLPTVFQK